MDYDYLDVSDGSGDASLMHIQTDRLTGATLIDVDTVSGVPAKFIGTYGTRLSSGLLDPTTKRDFKGHVSGSDLIIDSFLPGSTDAGNIQGQIVIVKPNSHWANRVAQFIQNVTGFGTPENHIVADLTADDITATTVATTGDTTVGGNIVINGTSRLTAANVTTADGANNVTPTKQLFSVTGLDKPATILTPIYSPADMMSGELKIRDNGTARALTWNANWIPIGLTLPTTTTANKWLYISYKYSSTDTKFHVVGVARQS